MVLSEETKSGITKGLLEEIYDDRLAKFQVEPLHVFSVQLLKKSQVELLDVSWKKRLEASQIELLEEC